MSKKKNLPTVSIVIAAYKPLRTLEKCLQSIQKQTYSPIEFFVVNAKNSDAKIAQQVQKIVKKYKGIYLEDGPERSIQRNCGITHAQGKYVLIIDQDMYLEPEVVEQCVQSIQKPGVRSILIPEISIGIGFWTEVVALERYVTTYLETSLNECIRFVSKKDAQSVGGFDPEIVGAEDSDFHFKISRLGETIKISAHINHDEGKTSFFDRVKKKYYYSRAFRKYLERYPEVAVKQFFPIKIAYFKHWRELLKHPHILGGMIMLRSAEILAGLYGIMTKSDGR